MIFSSSGSPRDAVADQQYIHETTVLGLQFLRAVQVAFSF
jgi:hypothetical protein